MAIRLIECRRVLKNTGSIYLHCDSTMSHYLKLAMDCIFEEKNFRNEIIWHYQSGTGPRKAFKRKHDTLLFYSRSHDTKFNRQSKPVVNPKRYKYVDEDGRYYDVNGQGNRYYLDEGQTCDDVWTYIQEKQFQQINSQSKERTGYPTQKPLRLLQRIIKASSNKGDVVLDPFCGCATTLEAAHKLKRRWIGIDIAIQPQVQALLQMNSFSDDTFSVIHVIQSCKIISEGGALLHHHVQPICIYTWHLTSYFSPLYPCRNCDFI